MNVDSLQELKIVSQTFILHILIWHIVEFLILFFGGKLKFEIHSKKKWKWCKTYMIVEFHFDIVRFKEHIKIY